MRRSKAIETPCALLAYGTSQIPFDRAPAFRGHKWTRRCAVAHGNKRASRSRALTIAIVVPCFNEEEGLAEFHRRLTAVMDGINIAWSVIYVDDGSTDGTRAVAEALAADARVAVLGLSRNFGKEAATTAGLDHADADAVVVIDADLQDPPEVIPELVAVWREGVDVVYAQRRMRVGESWAEAHHGGGLLPSDGRRGRRAHAA